MAASRIPATGAIAATSRSAPGIPTDLPACDAALDSAHLLHGQREVVIRHGSELYRLRHTRNDKLILTK